MTSFSDDIYLGGQFVIPGRAANPTLQQGVGPMGRVTYFNVIPLTKQTANVAALQHMTSGTPLTLAAGTGVTAGTAPDGSGRTVYVFDVARAPSLTGSADISAVTFTFRGFDDYGAPLTQTKVGVASATTGNLLKAFKSILSVTPNATDGVNNVSIGTSDIIGLPYAVTDAGFLTSVGWNNTLARDTGTFAPAIGTIPSTAALGDVRGTYLPSSACDGAKRLVIGMHLVASQCGSASALYTTTAGVTGLLGVPQV